MQNSIYSFLFVTSVALIFSVVLYLTYNKQRKKLESDLLKDSKKIKRKVTLFFWETFVFQQVLNLFFIFYMTPVVHFIISHQDYKTKTIFILLIYVLFLVSQVFITKSFIVNLRLYKKTIKKG